MRAIPKNVNKWAEDLFIGPRMLYYRKHGDLASVTCSACGEKFTVMHRVPKNADPFEADMIKTVDVRHNLVGKCAKCGSSGVFKAAGKCGSRFQSASFTYGQRMGEDFVFRMFEADRKSWANEKDETTIAEVARIILRRGKKAEKWWYAHNNYTGGCEWIKGWPSTYGNVPFKTGVFHPDTFGEIAKTPMLKYGDPKYYDTISYYSAFARYPDMELVQKAGMVDLVRALIYQYGANINPRGKTIEDRLRIYKSRLPELREHKGSLRYLHIYQRERREKAHYGKSDIEKEIYLSNMSQSEQDAFREVLKRASLDKLERYLEKQTSRRLYSDYISMRMRRGDDLDNEVYLFPKDLRRRHNELVTMLEKEKNDRYKAEMMMKWPQIEKKHDKLAKKYDYSKGKYMVRVAGNAAEIIEEGRILHHCVGSSNKYFSKHAKGESFILFLREVKEPEVPFATIEISGGTILQWYEAYDQKPDKKTIQPWLDEYVKRFEKKGA